jgi:hypothetical protein
MSAMKDGWKKTGVLRSGNPEPEKFTMQCDFSKEAGGSGAQYYTVQFGVAPPISGVFDCIAEIKWSTEGNDVFRQVSVGNGVVVSGTAQHVRVSVVDRTDLSLFAPPPPSEEYRVDVLVTPGVRPSQEQPPRLIPLAMTAPAVVFTAPGVYTLSPGGTVFIPIPRRAGVVSVNINVIAFPPGAPPPPFSPVLPGDSVAGFLVTPFPISLGAFDPVITEGRWIPVPPIATHLQLFNDSAVDEIQFTVAFGIEG